MLLKSGLGKINFSSKTRNVIMQSAPTPPPTPIKKYNNAKHYITPQDITIAIEEAKDTCKSDKQMMAVKWDIVYELWNHYQKQEDKNNIYDKVDVLEYFCDEDLESALECREYDL